MIWIIIIVAYLLLAAMAFGMFQDVKEDTWVLLVLALMFGWAIVPFFVALTLGRMIAHYLNKY